MNGAGVIQKAHDVAVSRRQKLRDFSEPPESILRLVPEVGAGGEWKSAEVAAIAGEADVVVPRGKESFAALPRELTVGGANA